MAVEPLSARDASRRRFLLGTLGALGAGLLAEAAGAVLAFLAPDAKSGGRRVPCGRVDGYAQGEVRLIPEGRLFVVRREDGFLALSQVCTHLGCLVPWDEARASFRCPCHGGAFDREGLVTGRPPQRPLDLVRLSIVNGELFADTGEIVKRKGFEPGQVVRP
jgi:cytochrome b6-f complex iron-sulfur subunit